MPRKCADPVEVALDAYYALDASGRDVFAAAVRYVERYAQAGALVNAAPPKRGRPPGSKTRSKVDGAAVNAAAEAGL